ncbi:lysozyme inhibitor LprI family protein [Hoeflea olei]|uniref:Lysozyme inhibitor LprI-like N-terminal domain-containing protein n=1 Tax=Hoeflea olei TaxID=1480615 RepID=A0A1C1YUY4_9HYPH|nr:lysozyme inhibitor LprI family protein [Hoeflea olei]OCW57362.1 hypothetical protein AWJ14_18030 [Hoeflea olei]
MTERCARGAKTFGLLTGLAAGLLLVAPAAAQTDMLNEDIALCQSAPENRIGGAAIGECLEAVSDTLDARIEAEIGELSDLWCTDRDQRSMRETQTAWSRMRDEECGLVARSPDNTPSYVNGAACRVLLARQRLTALRFVSTYANPLCPDYRLDDAASRRGVPAPGETVAIDDSRFSWRLAGTAAEPVLEALDSERGTTLSRPLDCTFCDGEDDNCSADGIFVMQEEEASDRPLLFAVCHAGAHSQRLTLFDPKLSGLDPVLEVTGAYYLEWEVANGLRVTPDGDPQKARSWPSYLTGE